LNFRGQSWFGAPLCMVSKARESAQIMAICADLRSSPKPKNPETVFPTRRTAERLIFSDVPVETKACVSYDTYRYATRCSDALVDSLK
jgi:hypothetical protein